MSTLDPGLARLRQAFVDLAEDAVTMTSCPDPERLWDAVRGERPPAEVRLLVLHTAECASCAESWRLAREVRAEGGISREAVRRTRWWGGVLPMAAAVAAVAFAGALVLRDGRSRVAPGYRDPRGAAVRALVAEDRPLPRASCVLRWSSAGAGARYDLRLATTALAVIHSARGLTATEHQVPPRVFTRLPPGARLIWQVEAVTPDGTRTASAAFVVHIQ